jgi:glycosyltransferase involved in cell wall biosynthesis
VSDRQPVAPRIGRRRRIAVVVPALELGGGVPAVAEFVCQTIEQSGAYDAQLVSLVPGARDGLGVALTRPGSWFRGVRTDEGLWNGRPFTRVGALMSEIELRRHYPRRALTDLVAGCDVIQVVCGSAACAWSVCGLGKPVSIQCATRAKVERRRRDANPSGLREWWRKGMTEFVDRMDDRALRAADAIQVENGWMHDYVKALTVGRDVDLRYLPPGVNTQRFMPMGHRDLAADPYVLSVGRLSDPRKNVDLLLDAYALLSPAVRNRLRVVLAGHSTPPITFWQRVEALGLRSRFEFIDGPSHQVLVDLYQRAGMFVLPSDEEGLGVVLLEAMACGVPAVSTRSGGPDGILADGVDGYLVPLADARALAARIEQLYLDEELNRAMGRRARLTIERRYSVETAGQAFLEVWDRLLHRSAARLTCAG